MKNKKQTLDLELTKARVLLYSLEKLLYRCLDDIYNLK